MNRVAGVAGLLLCAAVAPAQVIPLAGSWGFQLDAENAGHREAWYQKKLERDVIFLPGSTDQAGYGTKTKGPEKGWLSRPWIYEGPAWYQKDVVMPESWRGRHITLFLERPHWQTEVWVDGKAFGVENSLATPHVYELSEALTPGAHRLTICVDNSYRIDVGRNAHSVTEHTQTNWNGIVGRIELRASAPVWIDSAQVYPNITEGTARVEAVVRNATGKTMDGEMRAWVQNTLAGSSARIAITGAEQKVALTLPLGQHVRLWSEDDPAVYNLELSLATRAGQNRLPVEFGMRQIATRGTQFVLNGRPVFLRGTLECNIFPLTGYPPMTPEGWERLFRIARAYGLNHIRFHSWCPPEAAFVAADRAGFLLHVELPVWSNKAGKDAALDAFMRAEGHRMLKTYGNHPSFTMLCLGNELSGDYQFMDDLVAELKRADPRRLYTFTADYRRGVPGPTSDYYVSQGTQGVRLRIHGTRFGKTMSSTDVDFSAQVRATAVPLVAHELGQWAVYPSYGEIARYVGVLKPRNLEAFRDQLAARGMIDQAEAFQQASGRFSWLVYKEDMETALRTPGFGGFQLLQLEDFPGQGEALVGLLDSFWESKGLLAPAEFRRFCSQTVPLLRFGKFVWTFGETFTAKAEVAQYAAKALENAVGTWLVRDPSGREWGSGEFPAVSVPVGSVTPLGEIRLPLPRAGRAAQLKVTVALKGTEARNDWDLWVYPKQVEMPSPKDVLVTRRFDAVARKELAGGGKVVWLATPGQTSEGTLPMQFLPVFWSLSWFPKQPGTMGILCDLRHPALAEFPTEMHSNWQWWELTEEARAFVLDETPAGFRPIVQVIDDFHRNHKLGAVFEAKLGEGKLLACSLDLETNLAGRPVARQLRYSLLAYAAGERFQPKDALSVEVLGKLLGGR